MLRSAHKVSKGFANSVVLTQNSAGVSAIFLRSDIGSPNSSPTRLQHASIAASSLCTAKAIRDYFRGGVLPEPGTVCEISNKMFGEASDLPFESLVGEERELMENWSSLMIAAEVPGFGLFRGLSPPGKQMRPLYEQ